MIDIEVEVEVDFEHWRYTFSEEDLQCASPNNKKIAKTKLCSALKNAELVLKTDNPILFKEPQIICANEAFPEAAIADPLADIEVWNKWRSGVRIFPYPGKYAPLSITNQPPKTSSTSSVGVIGEIMAGLFGQAIVGHDVLVRVIHEWPDFIFFPVDGFYGFLEAKAFTPQPESYLDSFFKVPKNVLGECLVNATHQLTLDPFVKIWYSFTEIQQVLPSMRFSVNFFELDVSEERREKKQKRTPAPVIDGLGERAIQMAIIDLSNKIPDLMSKLSKKNNERKNAEQELIEKSNESIKSVLENIINLDLLALSEEDIKKITDSIGEQIKNFQLRDKKSDEKTDSSERDEPFQFNDESEHETKPPRRGKEFLCQIKLPRDMHKYLLDNWKSDVTLTNQPYKKIGDHQLWRCGSSIFVICDGTRETLMKIKEQMKNEQIKL